jgi:hypothetical protein
MSKDLQEAMYVRYIFHFSQKTNPNRKLIRDMAHMMDPDEDYITIATTEQQTAATKANRKKELEEAHAHLKGSFVRPLPVFFLSTPYPRSPLPHPRSSTPIVYPPLDSPYRRSTCCHLKRA